MKMVLFNIKANIGKRLEIISLFIVVCFYDHDNIVQNMLYAFVCWYFLKL